MSRNADAHPSTKEHKQPMKTNEAVAAAPLAIAAVLGFACLCVTPADAAEDLGAD